MESLSAVLSCCVANPVATGLCNMDAGSISLDFGVESCFGALISGADSSLVFLISAKDSSYPSTVHLNIQAACPTATESQMRCCSAVITRCAMLQGSRGNTAATAGSNALNSCSGHADTAAAKSHSAEALNLSKFKASSIVSIKLRLLYKSSALERMGWALNGA